MNRRELPQTCAVAATGLVLPRGAAFSAGRPKKKVADALLDWVRRNDSQTLLQLAAERGASPGAQELIRLARWFCDPWDQVSAAWSLLGLAVFSNGQEAYGFPGGADTLAFRRGKG